MRSAQAKPHSRTWKWPSVQPWLVYCAILVVYCIVYQVTKPDADYFENVVFHKFVAVGVAVFLFLAIVKLFRHWEASQIFKVLFWAIALIYTLGDIAFFLRQFKLNRFPYYPEVLVLCYAVAIVLQEKELPPTQAEARGRERKAKGEGGR